MANNYKYGRSKEEKVARILRSKGASVKSSPGSKGAADLKSVFHSGTKWVIQVKSTRGGEPKPPKPKEVGRLKQVATKSSATPVIAYVTPKGITYKSARSGRTLTPPKRKK